MAIIIIAYRAISLFSGWICGMLLLSYVNVLHQVPGVVPQPLPVIIETAEEPAAEESEIFLDESGEIPQNNEEIAIVEPEAIVEETEADSQETESDSQEAESPGAAEQGEKKVSEETRRFLEEIEREAEEEAKAALEKAGATVEAEKASEEAPGLQRMKLHFPCWHLILLAWQITHRL